MSKTTLGQKIGSLRREKEWTQEELAEKLGVSAQAVSKWENDVSCPDIMLLPEISKLFGVTVDALLGCEPQMPVQLVPKEERKKIDSLMLRIIVNSSDGDKVRINLPMTLIKTGIELGFNMSQVSGSSALDGIDLNQIMSMVENGLIGKLVEVESNDGDNVEIVVEEV
ncbi:MAG: helix-turn-helix transcriptional regulator [Ruminiclostridium sp.]|jgi:transcriptional regulator with XRE-family HTH domain|nr:helix-turn-helix transcriptional regulator [Ruminiclostridium sp.]